MKFYLVKPNFNFEFSRKMMRYLLAFIFFSLAAMDLAPKFKWDANNNKVVVFPYLVYCDKCHDVARFYLDVHKDYAAKYSCKKHSYASQGTLKFRIVYQLVPQHYYWHPNPSPELGEGGEE